MWAELAAVAANQGGVFTRDQASAAGFRGPAIRQLTASGGDWVVVRRGVYAERAHWEELDDHRGRPLARAWAVTVSMRTPHVISHDSAAHAWGLPLLRPSKPYVHVTRPGVTGSRSEHGVKHHLSKQGLEATYDVGGLVVTGLERTALDVAREHGWLAGLVTLDGAYRFGADPVVVEAVLAAMWSWPEVRPARRAAQHAMLGAETPLESLGRSMVIELGLPEPITQFPVAVSRGVAWCDLLVGAHVFELDGRKKYVDRARGGVADRDLEELIWEEKHRERDVAANGLGVSRLFWADCYGARRRAGLARMAADFEATVRRFGATPPPDVLAFAGRLSDVRLRRLRRDMLDPRPVPRERAGDLWYRAG